MKRIAMMLTFLTLLAGGGPGSCYAAERGSAEEAVAMVHQGAAYLHKHGRDATIAAVNAQQPQFRERDLYLFITDLQGRQLANASLPRLVGKDILELRDSDGKYFVKELIEVAKSKGKGWVDYRWPNPASGQIDAKSTYLERVGDLLIACGIYK